MINLILTSIIDLKLQNERKTKDHSLKHVKPVTYYVQKLSLDMTDQS